MKKRLLSFALITAMVVSLSACAGEKTAATGETDSQGQQSTDITAGQPGDQAAGTAAAGSTQNNGSEPSGKPLNIMFVNYGTQGDSGIGDIVIQALKDFGKKSGAKYNVFDCNNDTSVISPTMMDVCSSGEYDLVISGFYNMLEASEAAAAKYPQQKILLFDTEADYADGKNQNIRSVSSKQNECAFLAGSLAALLTESDAPLANPEKVVGFVGGGENTAIMDFLVGYIDGVNYVDSRINILYSFVGNWTDTAKAKELGLMQYQQKADVSFAVCGAAGLGVADAAKDANAYNIGVDYDVADSIKNTNPETAKHVITSAVKDFYTIMTRELNSVADGTTKWGTHTIYDYANGGSQLIDNEYFENEVPADVKAKYKEITDKLAAGEIKVGTAIGASQEQIDAYKKQAEPF